MNLLEYSLRMNFSLLFKQLISYAMEFLNQKSKDLVNVFTTNLLSTNRSFNYYVNWANINGYKGFLVESMLWMS